MNNKKYQLILGCLFGLAVFLRVYQLAKVPYALHRDELAIGYDAYSIFKTSHDHHGVGPWPINFQSIGDYKLPGLIYTTALSIKFLGLNSWAIRLPTALLASLLIPLSYLLVKELFNKQKPALITALLITFGIWHLTASRNVYEPAVAVSFSALMLWLFLKARQHSWWLVPTWLVFTLACFFYNAPLLLLPWLFLAIAVIYHAQFWPKKNSLKRWQSLAFFIGMFLSVVSILVIFSQVNAGKTGATIFFNPEIIIQTQAQQLNLMLWGVTAKLAYLINNQFTFTALYFIKGYLSSFDLNYLFFLGDHNPWHSLRELGFGQFNLALLPILLLSIGLLIKKLPQLTKPEKVLLSYLLISPLANAITIDAPITNRLMDFHLAVAILIGWGIWQFLTIKTRLRYDKAII
ncbi:MAG: phospholipid carrier-dependent glycosyltransferase, partial [Candidatus Pacebacteria bacterium]|nr:phospholipid carrier-dependent glycosyltransferase [Candidatus Paceibacterota bacterium]